jgi:hypothetical protein
MNVSELNSIHTPTHVRVLRDNGYWHHGILVEDPNIGRYIIHLNGEPHTNFLAKVKVDSGGDFVGEDHRGLSCAEYGPEVIRPDCVQVANWFVLHNDLTGVYDLLHCNCEHFATFYSAQVSILFNYCFVCSMLYSLLLL